MRDTRILNRRGTHSFSRRTLLHKDIFLKVDKEKLKGIIEVKRILNHAAT